MKSLFIMTVRNHNIDRQQKFTVENGRCFVRQYRLHPLSDIMVAEKEMPRPEFVKMMMQNMGTQIGMGAYADVYFNGNNYRKFAEGL